VILSHQFLSPTSQRRSNFSRNKITENLSSELTKLRVLGCSFLASREIGIAIRGNGGLNRSCASRISPPGHYIWIQTKGTAYNVRPHNPRNLPFGLRTLFRKPNIVLFRIFQPCFVSCRAPRDIRKPFVGVDVCVYDRVCV